MTTHKPNTKRLTERCVAPLAGARVDREAGVIRNVLICGFESVNGRDYPAAVFKRDFAKYEGRPVNFDHARDGTVSRRGGWLQNVTLGTDGRPRGDLHLLKTHPNYGPVMEAAERNPALFGLSHVAMCRTTAKGGRETVEAIERVESIDIVADPATTQSLFEGKTVQIKLRESLDRCIAKLAAAQQKPARKWLVLHEDDAGMAPLLDAPVDPPADDAGGGDAIKGGIRSVIMAVLDDDGIATDEKLKKIRLALQMQDKMTGDAPATDSGTSAAGDEPAEEGKRPTLKGLLAECKAAGLTATHEHLEALSEIPTAAGRAATIGLLVKGAKGAETPLSTPRTPTVKKESKGTTAERVTWD